VVIIEDFLLVSRIEQGRMKYEFVNVDMKKVVMDMVQSMKKEAEDGGLVLNIQIDDTSEFGVRIDKAKMKQVIHNVLSNAIRYTERGSINVLLSRNKENGKIRIAVSDTGIGISKKLMQKLFKKFSKGENNKLGSGIGLYVANEIVKSHKGKIWAESEGKGQGSTFYFSLPIA